LVGVRAAVECSEAALRPPGRDLLGRDAEAGREVGVRECDERGEAVGAHQQLAGEALGTLVVVAAAK
jgi:hypothetical protein